jgi:uncharacterized protein (DUF305 family)
MDLEKSPKTFTSTRAVVALILGATLLLGVAFFVGRATVPTEVMPTTTSAEAGFARDMQAHHLQAVDMSIIVRDRTNDEPTRLLAYDIARTQQQQAGQMYAWLTMWKLPQASREPVMTWMSRPLIDGSSHDHGGGANASAHVPGSPMPGLATGEQLAQLKSLSGVEAERLFLELMIAHHKGGVDMAEAVLQRTDNRLVTSLAKGMVAAQLSEIELMEQMLAERA